MTACGCGAQGDWKCYRCKAWLCDHCSREGGGWCSDCNQAQAERQAKRVKRSLGYGQVRYYGR